ncbi:BRCA1 C Terminus (BRCT) domain protein [Parabacteroides sp. AF17-3]|uniref:BRCT domain-containing protein n=1 Tax=Parabacteroides sp. AF17-3 TaxID=2293113 RepID=UPI000F00E42D|nr:BRCT domain-containing protein [Parabacteroides sp. AF17-3]RKU69566.1 BRCA1 C Terminus (BRCT) domain protein [Parabacteroides sp. AF17-3]
MNNNKQQIYDKIVKANKEYRNGTPIMSDLEYDTWIDKLKEIDPDNDWFKHIEPGMEVSENRKTKLPYPMKSLDKVKSLSELKKWFIKIGLKDTDEVVVTPKYDGISLLCNERTMMTYSRGGSDNEGLDCKKHMETMRSVYHDFHSPIEYTFGEAIITHDCWRKYFQGKINPLNGQPYKSARNTVSGLFRRDIPSSDLLKHVRLYRYGAFGEGSKGFDSYIDLVQYMQRIYGDSTCRSLLKVSDINEYNLKMLFDDWIRECAIDGLVLYVNDISKWDSIGRHPSTGNPQWAIAYKPEEFTSAEVTIVKYIDCKVSKNGYLRPTVAIEEVELEGATIENPTGYNARFCFDKGIGAGAEIRVIRSGAVIPKIVGVNKTVIKEITEIAFSNCPSCFNPTVWNETKTDRMCPDPNCPGRLLAKLVYFCEKMEYEDIGEETLKAIFNAGIETPRLLLQVDLSDLQKIDGIGYDTASKIIEKNRSIFDEGVSLPKLMEISDCFEGIGEKKATLLLSNIDNDTLRLWTNRELSTTDLLVIVNILNNTKGIGKKMIDEFLSNERVFVNWVNENQIPIDWNAKDTGDLLAGKKICFTGVRDRQLEALIMKAGGKVTNSISKNTSWLVADDPNSSSGKAVKARALGISIVTIDEIKNQLGL